MKFYFGKKKQNLNIEIINNNGNVVFSDKNINEKKSYSIDINKLEKGTYNIILFNDSYMELIKYTI